MACEICEGMQRTDREPAQSVKLISAHPVQTLHVAYMPNYGSLCAVSDSFALKVRRRPYIMLAVPNDCFRIGQMGHIRQHPFPHGLHCRSMQKNILNRFCVSQGRFIRG